MTQNAPNIILFFTDQQRADTIGALGNELIRTPALDRLVREGTAFTRAYTPSPVCMSARCCCATGQYAHQIGCVDNRTTLDASIPSFMQRLQAAGYQTHGTGKMHFKPDWRRMWGFDQRDTSEGGPFVGAYDSGNDDYHDYLHQLGLDDMEDPHGLLSEYYYIPQPSLISEKHHHTQWIADRSIDFLNQRDRSRPFFLQSSYLKPHPPFESPSPWNRLYRAVEMDDAFHPEDSDTADLFWNRFQNRYKYRDAGRDDWLLRTMKAAYYASISFIDHSIGQIISALSDEELDNTLIVFTADHGEMLGDFGCFGKRCMLDASARIPLLTRWPAHFAANQRCRRPASLIDLFTTFAQAAGLDKPTPRHSVSLMDLAANANRQSVISQYGQGRLGLYMLANEHEKYIYSAPDQRSLYLDNRLDPTEAKNLLDTPHGQRRSAALKAELIDTLKADAYDQPFDGNDFKSFAKADFFEDGREGLLYQDGQDVQNRIDALGSNYAREVMNHGFQNSEKILES